MQYKTEQFRLSCIQPDNLETVWNHVKELVGEALIHADGKYRLEDVHHALQEKKMQLWVVSGSEMGVYSVCVTQVVAYPAKKVLSILFCAGTHLAVWMEYLNTVIKDFAIANHCDAIEEYGRPGWAKYLDKLGYETIHTVCRLNLC